MIGKDDIKFNYSMNNETILITLGRQIRQMRLNKNFTQKELGEQSGLSRSAIANMENQGLGTMNTFIQVLRTLEKLEILNQFITEAPVSPLQIAKLHGKTRQRASSNRQPEENKEDSEW
jgi:transcriptional regulator with XRE-family HTH domain